MALMSRPCRPSRRSLSKILLLAFLVIVFPATALAAEPILDRVLRTKKVKVGVCFHMPPFGYIDEQGKWTGYEMELTREIVKRLGVEGDWERITPVTRGPMLQAGRVDFAACAISQTRSREEVFDFTVWHFEEGKRMLAPKAKGYKSLKDFIGKPIAVQQGSSAGPGLQDYFKKQGWPAPNLLIFPDNPAAFLGIKQGKTEGYSQDQAISVFVSKADPDFEFVGEYYQRTRYGFGVPHDNSKWRDRLNFILNDMFADGTFMKIYDEWFHPKTGKVPLPENVRESVRLLSDMPWPE
jgi:polar amino acid transport system substrate-binding protein